MRGKWTPGPWHLKGGDTPGFKTHSGQPGVYAAARPTDDFFILQIAEMATNVPDHERQANAYLIAAAPALYEALEALVAESNRLGPQLPYNAPTRAISEALEAARAALSLALPPKGDERGQ